MFVINAAAAILAAGTVMSAPLVSPKWRALLEPVGNATIRGGATAEAKDGSTHFILSIRNGTPGTTLTWHMHTGTCGQPGGIVGSGYPDLPVGAGGIGQLAVTLPVPPPVSGNSIIQIHGFGGAVQACGELRTVGE